MMILKLWWCRSSPRGCSPKWGGSPASFSIIVIFWPISISSIAPVKVVDETDKVICLLAHPHQIYFMARRDLQRPTLLSWGKKLGQRRCSLFCSFFYGRANQPLAGQYVPRQRWLWRRKSCQSCHFQTYFPAQTFRRYFCSMCPALISKYSYADSCAAMHYGIGKATKGPNTGIDWSWQQRTSNH